jgi:hypothetical protein
MAAASSVHELPRNNVKAAVAFVRRKLEELGRVPDDDLHVLLQLQDDATELVEALKALDVERRRAGLAGLS